MFVEQIDPHQTDPQLQRLVRKCVQGTATAAEIEAARQAAGLSPLEALLVAEFLRREMQTTFVGDVLHPLCGC